MRVILLVLCCLLTLGCGPNRQVEPGIVKFTAVETVPMQENKPHKTGRTSSIK